MRAVTLETLRADFEEVRKAVADTFYASARTDILAMEADEFADDCAEYDEWREQGRHQQADLEEWAYKVTRTYTLYRDGFTNEAALFKLSGGNIDPRKAGEA